MAQGRKNKVDIAQRQRLLLVVCSKRQEGSAADIADLRRALDEISMRKEEKRRQDKTGEREVRSEAKSSSEPDAG